MLLLLGAVSFTRFCRSPSTSLNASLDQFRQGTTLVLKHNLGKCHVYDSFLHSSVPAASWLGEGLCLLFIISSFRSLYMDLGAKIDFLKLLMAGGFYWPWNCMLHFCQRFFFFCQAASTWYMCQTTHTIVSLAVLAILSLNQQICLFFYFSFCGKCHHMEFWISDN